MKKFLYIIAVLALFLQACSEDKKVQTEQNIEKEKEVKQEPKVEQKVIKKAIKVDELKAFKSLPWHSQWAEAFAQAKAEQKSVIVLVEESYCKWCKKMKKGALSDERVQGLLQKYVLLKIKRSDKEQVAKLENFDGNIPSFFFMKNEKETTDSIVGYYSVDDFLGYMQEIEKDGF
jgi:thioredoxin-related protein